MPSEGGERCAAHFHPRCEGLLLLFFLRTSYTRNPTDRTQTATARDGGSRERAEGLGRTMCAEYVATNFLWLAAGGWPCARAPWPVHRRQGAGRARCSVLLDWPQPGDPFCSTVVFATRSWLQCPTRGSYCRRGVCRFSRCASGRWERSSRAALRPACSRCFLSRRCVLSAGTSSTCVVTAQPLSVLAAVWIALIRWDSTSRLPLVFLCVRRSKTYVYMIDHYFAGEDIH